MKYSKKDDRDSLDFANEVFKDGYKYSRYKRPSVFNDVIFPLTLIIISVFLLYIAIGT